ncbi:DUF177 domain-containing protein [Bifidobacterium sp. ESL0790]|uniref:YceD family protein n=1 Tax=Bifidobacterium sp. ESL0790 TaxID=2983233 RepID=UPI0023F6EF07|nr:DUF177 domain-containing protein [Bifidobacterium sp. ESL0790]WEV72668.1 DUF177 domain-containing protein [Bifidobacterium sp. ESL0790]
MTRPEDSQWAIPVSQVSSRPGLSKAIDQDFPAPSGVGDEVVGVREGEPVRVRGSFDSIADGLVFMGRFTAPMHAECTRCLTPINKDWELDVTAFFPYDPALANVSMPENDKGHGKGGKGGKNNNDVDLADAEDESEDAYPLSHDGGFADIEALLRDTLVENLPLQPLCKPDCKGLCPQCGVNLNDNPGHHHDVVDNRFASLAGLKAQLEKEEEAGK